MGHGLGGNDLSGGVCCARLSGSDPLSRHPGSSLTFVRAQCYRRWGIERVCVKRWFVRCDTPAANPLAYYPTHWLFDFSYPSAHLPPFAA